MVAASHACSCLCLSSLVFHTSCVPKLISETSGLTGLPRNGFEDACAWKRSWPTSPVDPKECCARDFGSCKAAWDDSWDDPIHCMSAFDLPSLKAHGPNGNASPACAKSCHRCVSCHQDPDLEGISLFIAALAELCSLAHPSATRETEAKATAATVEDSKLGRIPTSENSEIGKFRVTGGAEVVIPQDEQKLP